MTTFAPPRGMRDFYPEDYRLRRALFDAWEEAARRAGFEMFDAPVVETLELLERKAGEEIGDQIYTFEDKSGRKLALRPELTPSLARMIIARQGALSFPVKWSAIAQCFRYERMTRGRKREHYQLNLDIIGEESALAEAEVIGAAVGALRALGLTAEDFRVRIGSRVLLSALLARSGLAPEHHMACYLALDKRGKITDAEVATLLEKEGLAAADIERVFHLIGLHTLDAVRGASDGDEAVAGAADAIDALFAAAGELGYAEFLVFDLAVIRGLGYYTGIVFEAFDTGGKLRAIFGGGRYDRLLSDLGGQKMPCVGLGFGDVVVMELLADCGKLPSAARTVDCAVGFMDDASRGLALRAAAALRAAGASCDLALHAEKPRKFFQRADKSGAAEAIFIGPDEAASGRFTIKPLRGGEPRTATIEDLASPR
jgi:histidyl-tRNA synthetase